MTRRRSPFQVYWRYFSPDMEKRRMSSTARPKSQFRERGDGGETRPSRNGDPESESRKTHTETPLFLRRVGHALRTTLRRTQPLAYIEMIAGLGVLVAINLLFFREDPGFRGVNPNPLWIVVIAIAVRYGALPGYAVGALSACVYLVLVVLGAGSVSQANIFSVDVLLQPVLFLVAGGAIGELRESHKRAQKRLAAKYDEVEAGLQDVAQKYLASMELGRELERLISTQTSTVMTLYQAAKALENLEVRDLSPSVLELISSFVEAESCAIYLRQNGKFILEGGRPQNPGFERPEELDTTQGLPAIAIAERRTATVRDLVADATPAQVSRRRPLMVAPLLSEDDELMGMLVVERMPFLRFTPAAIKLFSLLGDWASSAFQRALLFRQTKDRNVEDEITGAYNYFYVLKRAEVEVERARRYEISLSLLAVSVADYEDIPSVRVPSVLRTLSLIFARQTRPYDVLGKYLTQGVFLLLLPHAGNQQSVFLGQRISREVEAFGFKPFDDDRDLKLLTGVASLSESITNAEVLVEEAIRVLYESADGTSYGKDGA